MPKSPKPCKPGQERDPTTGRCRKIKIRSVRSPRKTPPRKSPRKMSPPRKPVSPRKIPQRKPVSPRKTSPRKTPRKPVSPRKTSPRKTPRKTSPRPTSPKPTSPRPTSPKPTSPRPSPQTSHKLGKKILDLEPLYSTEKKGKTRVWYASIYHDTSTNTAHSVIQFGQENGKMQTSVLEYTKGKYIGKKNETTPLEQCTNETQRKWIDKKEKEGYKEENDAANDGAKDNDGVVADRYYPMLAKTYDPDDKKNKIVYPCHLQPKLDGLRCIVYTDSAGSVVFQSREGGHFVSMGHLIPELSSIFEEHPSVVFDGELYTTDIPFEELAGLIKKQKISAADKIRLRDVHYHIYDLIPSDTQPFHARYETLQAILHESYQHIDLVPTHIVHSIDEFKKWFKEYTTKHQMEGVMLRNSDGIYVQKHRSDDLQKYKEFLEEEFEIVGFKEGDGRDKGCVIWECQTPEKRRFYVRPKGTLKMRQDLFKHGNDYIGAKLTVIFQEKSEQGVPRFPIGKSIRDGF